MLSRFVRYIDFTCYSGFALFRPLIPTIGDVYRELLDPNTADIIDAWARSWLTIAEESVSPRAVQRRGMESLLKTLTARLAPDAQREFTLSLVRETSSPRFRAEMEKITNNPELLASKMLRGRPVPTETDRVIPQAFLDQVGTRTTTDTLHDERQRDALAALTEKILHIPDALRDMKTADSSFPWQTTRQMWNEADARAREKVRWDRRKTEDQEKSWNDLEQVGVHLTEDETEQIHTRLDAQQHHAAVAAEIRRSFSAQRKRHYLRLWALFWEHNSDLPQSEETARRAHVSLSTVKRFFADARSRGWIQR